MFEAVSFYPRPSCSIAQAINFSISTWISRVLFPVKADSFNRYRDLDQTCSGGMRVVMGVAADYLGVTIETPMYFSAGFSLYMPGSMEPFAETRSRKAIIYACDSVLRITGTAENGRTYLLYGIFPQVSLRNYDFSAPSFIEVREIGFLGIEKVLARYESLDFKYCTTGRIEIEK
jgi:hypothetical protein